jgi:hypothetical protein
MKDNEKIDGLRTEYLDAMAELGGLSVERASHLPSEIGMSALRSPQEAEESAKTVAKITRRIAEVCNRARAIEQRARGSIGIPALFQADVPNAIRVAIAILVGKSLSGSWMHECRDVGSFLQPAAGADANDLIAVREAFRKSGLLRQHIHCETGRTVDEMGNLSLTEGSFRKLLALEPDSECDDIIKARQLVGVPSKR